MRTSAVLVLTLLGTAVTIALAESSKPWFCHDLDCPDYSVVEKNEFYEVREYSKGTSWAAL